MSRRGPGKHTFVFWTQVAGTWVWQGISDLPSLSAVGELAVGGGLSAVLGAVLYLWLQDRQLPSRRRPTRTRQGERRSVAAVLLGSDDDAEELAALMHDATAAADTRDLGLRWLDRCSGPWVWTWALMRAWTAPLRAAWRRVAG